MIRKYYHYLIEPTDLGYEIQNTKNGNHYFVSFSKEKGMNCNCNGVLKGKTQLCKHKDMILKLYYMKKKSG